MSESDCPILGWPNARISMLTSNQAPVWINFVERWFTAMTEKKLRRRTRGSVRQLENAIKGNLTVTNESAKPIIWAGSVAVILAPVARVFKRPSETGH